ELAPVGERASLDDTALVEPVEEEAGARLSPLRLVQDPQRARGADHQGSPRRAGATGTEVRAGAVDDRRIPAIVRFARNARQTRLVDLEHLEQLGIPAFRVEVE